MNFNALVILMISMFFYVTAFSQTDVTIEEQDKKETIECSQKNEPHKYGGWYCPDNLKGFPAVNLEDWDKVPTINHKMPSEEEARSESSLIYVDMEKYPSAQPIDLNLPRLATFFNYSTNRKETIIIIQAFHIEKDSIVGFRYLNGGNGSARLNEVKLLSTPEIDKMKSGRFVSQSINIAASREKVWKVITDADFLSSYEPILKTGGNNSTSWRATTNMNFHYPNTQSKTASFGDELYGLYYIQNDYCCNGYTEKVLLFENQETEEINLEIVFGPFGDDYEEQKEIITKWAKKVKMLSEGC